MTSGIDIYDLIRMICLVASLILALAIYVLLGDRTHDKSRTAPFVNLNGSFVVSGIRCAYLFVAIAVLVLRIIDIIQICIEGTEDELATTLFTMIFGLLVVEFLLRIIADLIILIARALQSVCSHRQNAQAEQHFAPVPSGSPAVPPIPPVPAQPPHAETMPQSIPVPEESVSEPVARIVSRERENHTSEHNADTHPADHQMTERVRAAIEAANSIDESLIDPSLIEDDMLDPTSIDPASFDPRSFDQEALSSYSSAAETPTTRIDIQQSWDCTCGARGNTGAYCGHCGAPRPDHIHE